MKILNTEKEDYHVHSINFSDGWNTVDEMVQYAGKIGMKKIVICDHSQATLDYDHIALKCFRISYTQWKNLHNDVEVIFGVEADLLNEQGDICSHIQNVEGTFILLSHHEGVYSGDKKKIADGFIRAIERYHEKINILGHICLSLDGSDAKRVIDVANKYHIPIELNAKYYLRDPDKWKPVLENAEQVYVNSDAHMLIHLKELRKTALAKLKTEGYLK